MLFVEEEFEEEFYIEEFDNDLIEGDFEWDENEFVFGEEDLENEDEEENLFVLKLFVFFFLEYFLKLIFKVVIRYLVFLEWIIWVGRILCFWSK